MATIEELEKELSDKDIEIASLVEQNKELDALVDDLKKEVSDLEDEKSDLEQSAKVDIEDFTDEEITKAFRNIYKVDSSLVNDLKIEKFFENIDEFTLEQFEAFLTH